MPLCHDLSRAALSLLQEATSLVETVIHGECIEVMRGMEPDSVDAIVTDPPYGLEFMGKDWDGFKPSNARFRGLSEPKKDIGKQKSEMTPRMRRTPEAYVAGHAFQDWCTEWATEALRVAKPGAYLLAAGSPRTYHRLASGLEDAGWVLIDCIQHIHGQGFPKGKGQLKPGYEPWTLARKPAPRVLPLQIDACRIGTEPIERGRLGREEAVSNAYGKKLMGTAPQQTASGRWPANVILDEQSSRELDALSGVTKSNVGNRGGGKDASDSGGASRFFYCAKASRSERGEGNNHPTVKPQSLLRWMVRLVTPPHGTVLDPFCGSGTTILACRSEGFSCIGIEREAEYIGIIRKRLAAPKEATSQLSLLDAI